VLADLAEWQCADLVACRSTDPLRLLGLALSDGDTLRIIVANMTANGQKVVIEAGGHASCVLRSLDEESFLTATEEPDRFRASGQTVQPAEGELSLFLRAYALMCIDLRSRSGA
jgi:hypothetical protein